MNDNNKRRALGRGLEELFNIEDINYNKIEEKIMETASEKEVKEIPLTELRVNPYQPRKTFNDESLRELAESIKEHGVIQPIIVKKSIKGYEIVAGERRYRASRLAGKNTIPCIIREFTDDQMMEIAVLENLQREDLNAIEEANAYVKIMQAKNLTHEELAKVLGKSQSYVTNTIGLLRLPDEVKKLVVDDKLSMTHARILSKMSDYNTIISLANKVVNEGISVRELEDIAKNKDINKIVKVERKVKETDKKYLFAEEILSEKLDSKVRVFKNKIEIKLNNDNDLNRILEILNNGQ
jgi:ParB family chromosome partitioning protein